jgi:hypothetical protein
MSPTLYHPPKNFVRGWSGFYINPVDIRKIRGIYYKKRLFRLFNTEYEYTLNIIYYNPRSEYGANLAFIPGKGSSVILSEKYVEESHMTLRYKTEYEVKKEIETIYELQDQIKKFDEIKNKKLIEFVNKNKHLA